MVKKICSFIKSKKIEPGNWISIMHPWVTRSCDAGNYIQPEEYWQGLQLLQVSQ
jgi:hypothetical protein